MTKSQQDRLKELYARNELTVAKFNVIIKNGNIDELKQANFCYYALVNDIDKETELTPLMQAVLTEDQEKIEFLIEKGAKVGHLVKHKTAITHALNIGSDKLPKEDLTEQYSSEHTSPQEQQFQIAKLLIGKLSKEFKQDCINNELINASAQGNSDICKYLVEQHQGDVDAKSKSSSSETAIEMAIVNGHKTLFDELLALKPEEERNQVVQDCFVNVAKKGEPEMLKYLIDEKGAEIDGKNSDGHTALFLAAGWSKEENVGWLLNEGADFKLKSKGYSPIENISHRYFKSTFKLLLNKYPEGERHQAVQDCFVQTAKEKDVIEMLKYLIDEKGAKIDGKNSDGRTALFLAAGWSKKENVGWLLNEGADFKLKIDDIISPIENVLSYSKHSIFEQLLNKYPEEERNQVVQDCFVNVAKKGEPEMLKYLIDEKGAKIDGKNSDGRTALFLAAGWGKENVGWLLNEGADFKLKSNGYSPIENTSRRYFKSTFKLLLNKYPEGERHQAVQDCFVQIAKEKDVIEMLKYLIDEEGAEIDGKNSDGHTALFLAAGFDKKENALWLLNKGADFKLESNDCSPIKKALINSKYKTSA